jgi:peroxiredoxin Q/BCP
MIQLVGSQAANFQLEGSDGKTHSLQDYRGKTLIIYFYPRDDTPGCTKESCGFRDLKPDFDQRDTIILGVSKDSLASHHEFISKFDLPFVLLSDPETKMMQIYGAWGEKKLYGKVGIGCIRSTLIINPEGKVIKHWPKIKNAAEHPAEVLEFLKG